jgi:hypothetical protein
MLETGKDSRPLLSPQHAVDVTDFRRYFEGANRHVESSVGEELIEGIALLCTFE